MRRDHHQNDSLLLQWVQQRPETGPICASLRSKEPLVILPTTGELEQNNEKARESYKQALQFLGITNREGEVCIVRNHGNAHWDFSLGVAVNAAVVKNNGGNSHNGGSDNACAAYTFVQIIARTPELRDVEKVQNIISALESEDNAAAVAIKRLFDIFRKTPTYNSAPNDGLEPKHVRSFMAEALTLSCSTEGVKQDTKTRTMDAVNKVVKVPGQLIENDQLRDALESVGVACCCASELDEISDVAEILIKENHPLKTSADGSAKYYAVRRAFDAFSSRLIRTPAVTHVEYDETTGGEIPNRDDEKMAESMQRVINDEKMDKLLQLEEDSNLAKLLQLEEDYKLAKSLQQVSDDEERMVKEIIEEELNRISGIAEQIKSDELLAIKTAADQQTESDVAGQQSEEEEQRLAKEKQISEYALTATRLIQMEQDEALDKKLARGPGRRPTAPVVDQKKGNCCVVS